MRYLLFMLMIFFFMLSCVTYQSNPEFTTCVNSCREEKITCMVKAGTPSAIDRCDQTNAECMNKCSMFPPRIIVR
jgi:hypothetical protein